MPILIISIHENVILLRDLNKWRPQVITHGVGARYPNRVSAHTAVCYSDAVYLSHAINYRLSNTLKKFSVLTFSSSSAVSQGLPASFRSAATPAHIEARSRQEEKSFPRNG